MLLLLTFVLCQCVSSDSTITALRKSTTKVNKGFMDSVAGAGGAGLSMLVDGLLHPKHQYWFHSPNTVVEELPDGETTMDGGSFDSASQKDCAVMASANNGICSPPCATHWPNGACITKDFSGINCICVDPCTAFDQSAYDDYGHESLLSGCEHCVRHKSRSHLRFEKWTMAGSDYTCGYCGNTCVSADKNGPSRTLKEECADQYDWTIQDCRRVDLTSEDTAGSETDQSFDIYSDTPDAEDGASEEVAAAPPGR
jgi:hypothetical protein